MKSPFPSVLLAALALLGSVTARSQMMISTDVSFLYDDNINNNALQQKDRIVNAMVGLGHLWETESSEAQLFYLGDLSYYSTYISRSNQTHTAGFTYSRAFGEEGSTQLNAGVTYGARVDRPDYALYDHHQLSLYANLGHEFPGSWTIRGGYIFNTLSFAEIPDLDFTEHALFGQVNASLPTRTTIIVRGDFGAKVYAPIVDSTTSIGGGQHQTTYASSASTLQLSGMIRLGQSIFESTGLSVILRHQVNLAKESRYLTFVDGAISDDELFDDHYAYEGPQLSVILTQVIGTSTIVRLSGGLQRRWYSARQAYDLAGNVVADHRQDTRTNASASIEHSLSAAGMTLTLSYDHIINASNDDWFRYSNDAVALELSVPFTF